jgi:hypothetical protein
MSSIRTFFTDPPKDWLERKRKIVKVDFVAQAIGDPSCRLCKGIGICSYCNGTAKCNACVNGEVICDRCGYEHPCDDCGGTEVCMQCLKGVCPCVEDMNGRRVD